VNILTFSLTRCQIPGYFVDFAPSGHLAKDDTTYLATEDLINGRRLFERTFVDDALSHLLHEEHERVQRLLDVVLP